MDLKIFFKKLSEALNHLLTHWVAIVAFIYSFATLLNIIYVNTLFEKFSLNPWEYYEAHDVFIGSFMRSSLVVSSLFIIVISFIVIVLASISEKDAQKKKEDEEDHQETKSQSLSLPAFTGIVLATASLFPMHLSQEKAKEDFFNIAFMSNNLLNIELKDKTRILNLKLINSPGKFHIYYNQNTQQVEILNEGEITKISPTSKITLSKNDYENEIRLRVLGASTDNERKSFLIENSKFPKLSNK